KCQAENEDNAPKCGQCGAMLGRRRGRRRSVAPESDSPFAAEVAAHNRPALRAYRLALLSILPGAGLIAGPIASVLGLRARLRGRRDPHFTARSPAMAAFILGTTCAVTNWVGFTLMYLGLREAGWL